MTRYHGLPAVDGAPSFPLFALALITRIDHVAARSTSWLIEMAWWEIIEMDGPAVEGAPSFLFFSLALAIGPVARNKSVVGSFDTT